MKNSNGEPEFAIIINPGGGNSDDDFAAKIRDGFSASGRSFLCLETDAEKGATPAVEEALTKGVSMIVVCGGDGTVMGAVNALGKSESDATLAIIPGGTANLLATALHIPTDMEKALEIALNGEIQSIDLGDCEGTLFALGLGLGLTEKLISQTSSEEKERWGKLAYAKALLSELGARPHQFSFKLDEGETQTARGVAVIIANAGDAGGSLKFAPDAQMDDGKLDLVILHRFEPKDAVRLLWNGLCGKLERDRVVSTFQATKISIESDPPLDLQIDGEEVELRPPLVTQARPGALKVKVPTPEMVESPVEAIIKSPARWPLVAALFALLAIGAFCTKTRRKI